MSELSTYIDWEQRRLPGIEMTPNGFDLYCSAFRLRPDQLIGKSVLDLGAGASDFTARVNELGGFGVAVDLRYGTQSAVDLAGNVRARFDEEDLGDLDDILARFVSSISLDPGHYISSNINALPFRDNSFDLVVSSHLLYRHLVGNPISADASLHMLKEILRITKPGGKIKDFPSTKTLPPVDLTMATHIAAMAEILDIDETVDETTILPENEQEDIRKSNLYCLLTLALREGLIDMPGFFRVKDTTGIQAGYVMEITKKETRKIKLGRLIAS